MFFLFFTFYFINFLLHCLHSARCTVERVARGCLLFRSAMCNARFTLADLTPRLCANTVGWANVNGFPTRNRMSGAHWEVVGSRTCTTQLRVVISKAPSPYQPWSRTILYDSLVPTDANVRIARHSASINGAPTRRRMVSFRFASDYIGGQSGHRIG